MPKQLPSLIGNEGLFEVISTAGDCQRVKPGDWVIPNMTGWGTWRSHAIESENNFIRLPSPRLEGGKLTIEACSTIAINPVTALRMLKDFTQLQPHDTVIQNGANSSVGKLFSFFFI